MLLWESPFANASQIEQIRVQIMSKKLKLSDIMHSFSNNVESICFMQLCIKEHSDLDNSYFMGKISGLIDANNSIAIWTNHLELLDERLKKFGCKFD